MFKSFKFNKPGGNSQEAPGVIEVNLIPDIKFELLRTRIMRTRVITVAILVIIGAVAGVAILASITFGLQTVLLASADKRIDDEFGKYKNYEGVNQIITVQNQLSKIGALHQAKPISSRLFNIVVSVIDGSNGAVLLSKLEYNSATGDIVIEGQSSDGFVGVERMQKSIEATQISYVDDSDEEQVFPLTDKVFPLESPAYGQNAQGAQVLIFKIGFKAASEMFNSDLDLKLVAPGRADVTDSTLVIPNDIFAPKVQAVLPTDKVTNGEGE